MVEIRLEEFLSFVQPYEKRVHNLACFLAGRKRATDLALQALELAYQAFLSGSPMEDETIYRIACSVLLSRRTSPTNGLDLSPSFGAALFLRDALGLAYPQIAAILDMSPSQTAEAVATARWAMCHRKPHRLVAGSQA